MKNRVPMTSADYNYVRDLVRDQSALTLEPGKEYLLESRLEPLAKTEGFPGYEHLVRRLRTGPITDLHRKVVEAMTNNETTFFRDPRVFAMLSSSVLPALIAARSAERSINIWCAGCSTGQEPYSVAMLLHERMPSLDGWNIRIVASDISRDVLARARAGRYNQTEVNRGLPASRLVKYFVQDGSAWVLSPEIRRMVEFREINLIQSWQNLPAIHLILMRNVLIYFDVAVKKTILEKAGQVLDPRGFLVLGGAETTTNLHDAFEPVSFGGAVCFRPRAARQA